MNVTNKKQIIKANQTLVERGTSNFFYCNQSSAPFTLRLSDGSSLIMSSRRKIKLQEALDIFYLENDSNQDIELNYTMGFGEFSDESLFVEGEINVSSSENKHVNILPKKMSEISIQTITIPECGFIEIDPSHYNFYRIQNTGLNKLRLYSADGFVLAPLGTEELQLKNPFNIFGKTGDTFVLGGSL